MAVTIMEALQSADYNLQKHMKLEFARSIAREQLHNAVILLEKGYSLDDEVEPILEEYGNVNDVPEKK